MSLPLPGFFNLHFQKAMKVRSAWQVQTGLPGTRPVKSRSLMCLKEGAQGYETPGEQRHLGAVGLVCLCKAEQDLPGMGTLVFPVLGCSFLP